MMPPEATGPVGSPPLLSMEPLLALWQCSLIWGRANLEGFGLFWGLRSPGEDMLPALSEALDQQLRSPALLELVRPLVQMMNAPTRLGFLALLPFSGFSFSGFSGTLLPWRTSR
jgi:hypothetical protein